MRFLNNMACHHVLFLSFKGGRLDEWFCQKRAIVITVALGMFLALGVTAHAATAKMPNIIFIMADDLGYGDLGCYGQKHFETPRLDQMAAEGIRFTQYYAGSTVCAPSRSVLMTGLHTGHTRIRGNGLVPLDYGDLTVAEMLKQKSYETCVIGKWGLGEPGSTGLPNLQGFDEWFGFLNQKEAHNHYPPYFWRNQELRGIPQNANGQKGLYIHYKFTEGATNFIRMPHKNPYFLYLAYTLPHKHVEAPTTKPYADKDWPEPQKMLAAMIYRLDLHVGKILDALDETGQAQNTIVFFCSDNGPHNQEGVDPDFFQSSGPFRGIKRDLYEGGIRSPMIIRWKGHIQPGQVSDQVWAAWDVFPTLSELAGLKAPVGLDGESMVDAILKGRTKEHDPLYWEFHEGGFHQAVRMGDWKGVRHGIQEPLELYDLSKDPGEKHNLADRERRVVGRMEDFLKTARSESNEWPVQ
jgi:arylsulfatase A-like enzyme